MMPQLNTISPRANATIVAGANGTANATVSTTTFTTAPITINSGDTVLAVALIPTTASPLSISSPSNPNWVASTLFSTAPFFVDMWVLQNPVPASEPITFTRPTAGFGMAVVQVYGGVGQVASIVPAAAISTMNPCSSPMVTVTVPGSMLVGAFTVNRGTAQGFSSTGSRIQVVGGSYATALVDQTVATAGNAQVSFSSTSSQPAGFNCFPASILLEPAATTPPPPLSGIPVIVEAVVQWRQQAQADKIYLMPPAQRAASLAQLYALAQELKQAQIAQLQ